MSGVEHYREAERLLETVETVATPGGPTYISDAPEHVNTIAAAQVHATLALAAATALANTVDGAPHVEEAWFDWTAAVIT